MASRRLTAAEKGKGLPPSSTDTNRKRIRAPDFDFSDLRIQKTLIGKLINPKEQRVEHLILELRKQWALRGKVIRADLENDCFQFRFDRYEDLQCVLLNRPYQVTNIITGWLFWNTGNLSFLAPSHPKSPSGSRGLPLHFWHEKMVYNIASELGQLIRILLDTLEPLTLESMVDFSTGEEVPITFQYERIANFCKICNMLTHTYRYCTMKVPNQSLDDQLNSHYSGSYRDLPVSRRYSSQNDRQTPYSPRLPPPVRANSREMRLFIKGTFGDRVTSEASRVRPLKNKITPDDTSWSPPKTVQGPVSATQERKSVKERLRLPPPPQLQWRVRERQNTPPLPPLPPPMQDLAVTTPTPTLGNNLHECEFSKQLIPTTEEVLGDLREVTLQYVHCVDPIESAARRRRVIQDEADLMTNTAANIVAAATASITQNAITLTNDPDTILLPNSEEPQPISGPIGSSSGMPTGSKTASTTGVKRRGRPPGTKKTQINPKIMGGSAKKRIFSKVQASPARTNSTPSSAMRARAITSSSSVISKTAAPINSPKISSNNPGFHNPGNPLP
ncbi:LOW QUALITY PROTEIN: hypothetical protein BRARA_I02508 [Brassica rapa]|uniref:DUF4283 domain-containing protein n=2 Tax=Brassica campestris TaxID=3711 RepID=A0A397XWS0_BRACM|nr:LOW QUALITY PROTEIN: hypothetical protein BRARA_I02508 [Brassica rapa]